MGFPSSNYNFIINIGKKLKKVMFLLVNFVINPQLLSAIKPKR